MLTKRVSIKVKVPIGKYCYNYEKGIECNSYIGVECQHGFDPVSGETNIVLKPPECLNLKKCK